MNNLLVIGGFTESRRLIEPVAEEAVRQGFGDDAAVLTLREAYAMSSERLRAMMAGSRALTHSAGIITVPDARQRTHDSELPETLTVVAAPEPRGIGRLAWAAASKTAHHMIDASEDSGNAHRKVVAGNTAELLAHPIANLFSIAPDIADFSTLDRLAERRIAASGRLGYFPMTGDEFYADSWVPRFDATIDLINDGAVVRRLVGGHDDLLIDAPGVLQDIDHAYARGHIGQPLT